MSGSVAERVLRGRQAEDVLRAGVMHAAVSELNRRAFDLFVSAGNDEIGDQLRADALRMVHGADHFLAVLREWVVEARELLDEPERVADHV